MTIHVLMVLDASELSGLKPYQSGVFTNMMMSGRKGG